MNASNFEASQIISNIAGNIILYASYVCLIGGLIGNILNILIFGSVKTFHGNQTAFYLIVESITDCIIILNIFAARIFLYGYNIDLTRQSTILCKIRSAMTQSSLLISLTTICFAAIDQYLVTSYKISLRRKSTLKLAQYLTFINIVVWILHGIPFVIFYSILPVIGCDISNRVFDLYVSIVYISILNGILPLLVSSAFSALAYRNVRRIIRRQIPLQRRRLDQQLTAMVFSRVAFLVIVSIPYGLYLLCRRNRPTMINESIAVAVDLLFLAITSSLFHLNYVVSDHWIN